MMRDGLSPNGQASSATRREGLPLTGVRVLDMTHHLAGPVAGQVLADLGAEVIKIEGPTRPDHVRNNAPVPDVPGDKYNRSTYFNEINRSKQSLIVDLKQPAGRDIVKKLVAVSDVLVENNSAGVMDRLGLGYETLSAINPRFIMASLNAFGSSGPYKKYSSFGPGIDSMSGIASLTGYEGGPPLKPDASFTDENAGLFAGLAILFALRHREQTGEGQFVDLSMRESLVPLFGEAILEYGLTGRIPQRKGNTHSSAAPHNVYPSLGEDSWIAIAVENDSQWSALRDLVGENWAAADTYATGTGRWKNRTELDELLGNWTASFDNRELMERLQAAGVPAGAVLDERGLVADPQLRARGFWQTGDHPVAGEMLYRRLGFKSSPDLLRSPEPAPTFGQNNREILMKLAGVTPEQYEELVASRIVSESLLTPATHAAVG